MNRLWLALAGLAAVAFAVVLSRPGVRGEDEPSPKEAVPLKVVVHVNFGDAERQGHGLKNVENVLKEDGKSQVEVVCHGAGLSLLVKKQSKHGDKVAALAKKGVRFAACENTMRDKSVSKDDLLAGVTTVPSGAAEVIRKQHGGYAYFKP